MAHDTTAPLRVNLSNTAFISRRLPSLTHRTTASEWDSEWPAEMAIPVPGTQNATVRPPTKTSHRNALDDVSDAADLLDHHFEVILLGAIFTLLMVMIFVFNLLISYKFASPNMEMWINIRRALIAAAALVFMYLLDPRWHQWREHPRRIGSAWKKVLKLGERGYARGISRWYLEWYRWRSSYRPPKRVTIV